MFKVTFWDRDAERLVTFECESVNIEDRVLNNSFFPLGPIKIETVKIFPNEA